MLQILKGFTTLHFFIWKIHDKHNHMPVVPHGTSELKDHSNEISLEKERKKYIVRRSKQILYPNSFRNQK